MLLCCLRLLKGYPCLKWYLKTFCSSPQLKGSDVSLAVWFVAQSATTNPAKLNSRFSTKLSGCCRMAPSIAIDTGLLSVNFCKIGLIKERVNRGGQRWPVLNVASEKILTPRNRGWRWRKKSPLGQFRWQAECVDRGLLVVRTRIEWNEYQ